MANKHAVLAVLKAISIPYRNDYDRLIIANHAYLTTEGFHLIATGEKADGLQALSWFAEIDADAPEVGLDGWQALDQAYSFAYIKSEGQREKLQVTGIVMDDVLVIHFLSPGQDFRPSTAELPVSEFATGPKGAAGGLSNVDKLLGKLNTALTAALHTPPKAEQSAKQPTSSNPASTARQTDSRTTAQETEEELQGLRDIPTIGDSDLNPPGLPGGFHPGRPGIIGDPDDPGLRSGGGMHVGPNDPIFSRRFPGNPHPEGPLPGVRYDPVAPFGEPGFNARDFHRGSRGGLPGRGLDPDLEQPGRRFGDRGFDDPTMGGGFNNRFPF